MNFSKISSFIYFLLFLRIIICDYQIFPIYQSPIVPYSSAKGDLTYYVFHFQNPTEIRYQANIRIVFPKEFSSILIKSSPECFIWNGNWYTQLNCANDKPFSVKMFVGNMTTDIKKVIVGQIQNPTMFESSGAFSIYTLYEDGIVDSNENFGFVAFSKPPSYLLNANVYPNGRVLMNYQTTYTFIFSTSIKVPPGSSIRVTFPEGFFTDRGSCNVNGVSGSAPISETLHNGRMILCKGVWKELGSSETMTIAGVKSPGASGSRSGFKIDIFQQTTPILLQTLNFDGNVVIDVGSLSIDLFRGNEFKYENITYTWKVCFDTPVGPDGILYMNFTSDWTLYSPNCTVTTGVQKKNDGSQITCSRIDNQFSYTLSNFQAIGGSLGCLFINIELQTPKLEGFYLVIISTFHTYYNSIIDLNSYAVWINSTYGTSEKFRAHAVQRPIKLPAGEAGPLEITYFLKNELPPTFESTEGKFVINIYPKINKPVEANYGKVKCFFYNTIISGKDGCTQSFDDTAADHTTITVYTPELHSFKESELPITITTSGQQPGFRAGILLDTLIKRYLFQIRIYKNGNANFHEVHFTEFIPDYLKLVNADLLITPFIKNIGQWNYLSIWHKLKHDLKRIDGPWERNYLFRLNFDHAGNAWESGLGYTSYGAGSLIQIPCTTTTPTILKADPYIKCELLVGPYTFKGVIYDESVINIYGFEDLNMNDEIIIHIPRIKNGPSASTNAWVTFEVLEETHGQDLPYVILYTRKFIVMNTVNSPIATTQILTVTPSTNIVNKDASYAISFTTSGGTLAKYVIFIFPPASDNTGFVTPTTRVSLKCPAAGTDDCYIYDFDTQWVLFVPQTPTSTISTTIPIGNFKTGQWQANSVVRAISITAGQTIIDDISTTISILAEPFTVMNFVPIDATVYQKSEHQFEITWTSKNLIPAGGSIKLTFTNIQTQVTSDFFCITSGFSVLSTNQEEKIQCEKLSTTVIKIGNLNPMAAGTALSVKLYLFTGDKATQIATPATVKIETFRDSAAIQLKLVEVGTTNLIATYDDAIGMESLSVVSPVKKRIRKNQISPVSLSITTGSSVIDTIKVVFPTGFTNPASPTLDVAYCSINDGTTLKAAICDYTESPLTYTVTTSLTSGTNYELLLGTLVTAPLTGVKYPSTPGYYNIEVYLQTGSTVVEQVSDYIYVAPDVFLDFEVKFAHRTANQPNLFIFNMKLDITGLASYSDPTKPGRIYLEFPVKATDGTTNAFAADLGTGKDTSDLIPCSVFVDSFEKDLKCRLIKGYTGLSTDYAKIEIINFVAIPASKPVKIVLMNIKNPSVAVQDVDIRVTMQEITLTTGVISYIYQDFFNLFMNIDLTAPDGTSYIANYGGAGGPKFEAGSKLQNTPKSLDLMLYSGIGTLNTGDYIIFFLPKVSSTSIGIDGLSFGKFIDCPYTNCYSMPAENIIVYEITGTGINSVSTQLKGLTVFQYASNVDITFPAMIIKNGLFTHTVTHVYLQADQMLLVSTLTSSAFDVFHVDSKRANRKNTEVIVSFTPGFDIPATGSILIEFTATDFPKVYGNCRSFVTHSSTPSILTSNIGDNIGEISCYKQTASSWYISGFKTLLKTNLVKIYGIVDIGATTANNIKIYTYGNQHKTNIKTNGWMIENDLAVASLTLDTKDRIDYDSSWTFKIFDFNINFAVDPSNTNKIAPLDIFFTAPATTYSTSDAISIEIVKTRVFGNTDWNPYNAANNYKCLLYDITTSTHKICKLTITTPGTSVLYSMEIISGLTSNDKYKITITSQFLDGGINGINYPTQTGVYLIMIGLKPSGGAETYRSNQYFTTYADKFKTLVFKSYNIESQQKNLIGINIETNIVLSSTDNLVIEFPTKSVDGVDLFDNNLGISGSYNGYRLVVEVLPITITVECVLYNGNKVNSLPAKVVCGNFASMATQFELFFEIYNPTVAAGKILSIPISIYTTENTHKIYINFQFIENAFQIVPSDATTAALTLGFSGPATVGLTNSLLVTYAGTKTILPLEALVLEFSTPISPSYTSSCSSASVCNFKYLSKLNKGLITAGSSGISPQILTIDNFKMQSYTLPVAEQTVTGYVSYSSDLTFYKVSGTYPTLNSLSTGSTLTITADSLEQQQKTTYLIKIELDFSKKLIKTIMIKIPGLTFLYHDCIIDLSSVNIEISYCNIDSNVIIAKIHRKTVDYINSDFLVLRTREYSVVNPAAGNINVDLKVYMTQTIDFTSTDYLYISQSFTNKITIANAQLGIPPPDFIQFSELQSYDRTFQATSGTFSSGTYSTLKFKLKMIAAHTNSFLYVKIPVADLIIILNPQNTPTSSDIKFAKLLCLLNDIKHSCSIEVDPVDSTLNKIEITVPTIAIGDLDVSIGIPEKYLDGTDSYLITGFKAGNSLCSSFEIYHTSAQMVSPYVTNDPSYLNLFAADPFLLKLALSSTIFSINYMTSLVNSKNIFEIKIYTFGTNYIRKVIIKFPVLDDNNNRIFEPDLGSFTDGGEFPCEIAEAYDSNSRIRCFMIKGKDSNYGYPASVIMEGFAASLTAATLYLAGFKNPVAADTVVSLEVLVYTSTATNVYYKIFDNIFITSGASIASTAGTDIEMDKALSRKDAKGKIENTGSMLVSGSLILIEDVSGVNSGCYFTRDLTNSLFTAYASGSKYLIRKLGSSIATGGIYTVTNFNCNRRTLQNFIVHHYDTKTTGVINTLSINNANLQTLATQTSASSFSVKASSNFATTTLSSAIITLTVAVGSYSTITFYKSNIIKLRFVGNGGTYFKFDSLTTSSCYILEALTSQENQISTSCSFTSDDVITLSNWNPSVFSATLTFKILITYTVGTSGTTSLTSDIFYFYNSVTMGDNDPFLFISLGTALIISDSIAAGLTYVSSSFTYSASKYKLILVLTNNDVNYGVDGVTPFNMYITVDGYPDKVAFFAPCCSAWTVSMTAATPNTGTYFLNGESWSIVQNINNIQITSQSTPAIYWPTGETLTFEIEFQDDIMLGSYLLGVAYFEIQIESNNKLRFWHPYPGKGVGTSTTLSTISLTPSTPTEIKISINGLQRSIGVLNALIVHFLDDWDFDFVKTTTDFQMSCIIVFGGVAVDNLCYGHTVLNTFSGNFITVVPTSSIAAGANVIIYISMIKTPSAFNSANGINLYISNYNYIVGVGGLTNLLNSLTAQKITSVIFEGDSISYTTFSQTNLGDTGTYALNFDLTAEAIAESTIASYGITYTLGGGSFSSNFIYINPSYGGPVSSVSQGVITCASTDVDISNCRLYPPPFGVIVAKTTSISSSVSLTFAAKHVPFKIYKGSDYDYAATIYSCANGDQTSTATLAHSNTKIRGKLIGNSATLTTIYYDLLYSKYATGQQTNFKTSFTLSANLDSIFDNGLIELNIDPASITVISGCLATSNYDTNLIDAPLVCTVTAGKITVTSKKTVPSGSIISLYFTVSQNFQTSPIFSSFYQYKNYISSTNFIEVAGSITTNSEPTKVVPLLTPLSKDFIYIYPFFINAYRHTTQNPLRILFKITAPITYDTGNSKIILETTINNYFPASATLCKYYFKKYKYIDYEPYKTISTTVWPSDLPVYFTRKLYHFKVPSGGLLANTLYELIVTTDSNNGVEGYLNAGYKTKTFLKVTFVKNNVNTYYSEERMIANQAATAFHSFYFLNYLFVTHKMADSLTTLFFGIKNSQATLIFPNGYFEIEFPTKYSSTINMFYQNLDGVTASNEENKCMILTYDTSTGGSQKPRCIIVYGDTSKGLPAIIRIENLPVIPSGQILQIGIENIKLPPVAPVSLKVVYYEYDSTNNYWKKYFLRINEAFDVVTVAAATPLTSSSFTVTTGTNTYSATGNTWQSSVNMASDYQKIRLSFTNGYIVESENSIVSTVAVPGITTLTDGTNYKVFKNRKNPTAYIIVYSGSLTSSKKIQITNIRNPSADLSTLYATTPQIDVMFYKTDLEFESISYSVPTLIAKSQTLNFISGISLMIAGLTTPINADGYINLAFTNSTGVLSDSLEITVNSGKFKNCYMSVTTSPASYTYDPLMKCQADGSKLIINILRTETIASMTISTLYTNAGSSALTFSANYYYKGVNTVAVSWNSGTLSLSPFYDSTKTSFQFIQTNYLYSIPNYLILIYEKSIIATSSFKTPFRLQFKTTMSLLADESITLKPTVTLELQPDSYATVALYCSLHTYTAEYQIGLGYISHNCLYDTTNYFAIKIPKATFAIGDYILRIDNIKEAGVSIPTFDKRIESSLEYLEGGVVKMKDVIYVTPPAMSYNKFSIIHYSSFISDYDFLKIKITPFSLTKYIKPTVTKEMIIRFEFDTSYYLSDLGSEAVGSYDNYKVTGTSTVSGDETDHIIIPIASVSTPSKSIILYGDSFQSNTRISIPIHDIFSNVDYEFLIPMIKNPATLNYPLNINVKAVYYDTDLPYETTLLNYDLRNHAFTTTSTSSTVNPVISVDKTRVQETNVALTLTISSSLSINSNYLVAVRILSGFKTTSFSAATSTGYTIYYLSKLNMFVLIPTSTYASPNVITINGLANLDYISNFAASSIIYTTNSKKTTGSSNVISMTSFSNFVIAANSFSKDEGLTNVGSKGRYILDMTGTYGFNFLNLGVAIFNLPASLKPVDNLQLGDYCQVIIPSTINGGVNIDTSKNTIVCYRSGSNKYVLRGTGAQNPFGAFKIWFYLEVVSLTPTTITSVDIYKDEIDNTNKIITGDLSSTASFSTKSKVNLLSIKYLTFYYFVYDSETGPLRLTFKIRPIGTLSFVNDAKLVLIMPQDFSLPADASKVLYVRYGLISSGKTFVTVVNPVISVVASITSITIPIVSGYNILDSQTYYLLIDTVYAASNGVIRPTTPGLYTFKLKWLDTGANTLTQIGSYDYMLTPKDTIKANSVTNLNLEVSYATILKFLMTPNKDIANTKQEIWLEFTTNDGLNSIFSSDLGLAMTKTAQYISCSEALTENKISATRLSCVVWIGDSSISVRKPAIIKIPISNAILTDAILNFYIANIMNPTIVYNNLIYIKIMKECRLDGLMCIYVSRKTYFKSISAAGLTFSGIYDNPGLSDPIVLTNSVTHSFSFLSTGSITNNDYVVLKYPTYNLKLPDTCTSSQGTCMSFPLCNWILLQSVTIPANTATIIDITTNNARYVDVKGNVPEPISYVDAFMWKGLTPFGSIDNQHYKHPKYEPIIVGISLTITSTRSYPLFPGAPQNFWIRQFNNYAHINANGIWLNDEIQEFILRAETDSISKVFYGNGGFRSFCNASLNLGAPLRNDPYPAQMKCSISNRHEIRIEKHQNYYFPSFISQFTTFNLMINFYLYVELGEPGSTVLFTLYSVATKGENTYITKGTISISLDPRLEPDYKDLTFNTLSFYDRKGKPGESVEFYMLLKPYTLKSAYTVNTIVFVIPDEFAYPAVKDLYCEFKGVTVLPVQSCKLQRILGRTLVTLVPDNTYTNEIKIVRLTENPNVDPPLGGQFIVPAIAGNNYVLEANMYALPTLVERGKANISQIYPDQLAVANVFIDPFLDADTFSLIRVNFKNGAREIPEGYDRNIHILYSSIALIFQTTKGYDNSLGTGQANNSEIGCAHSTGITVTFKKKLKCFLKTGTNVDDLPEIQVFNYDAIPPNTDVEFYIARIKSLPATLTATITIAVRNYYKEKYGIVYLYKPLDILPVANSILATTDGIGAFTTISGGTVLGTAIYSIGITITAIIDVTDYLALEFPTDSFDRNALDYSGVTTDIPAKVFVFPYSSQVYIQPTVALGVGGVNIRLQGLASPAYSGQIKTKIKAWSLVNKKRKDIFDLDAFLGANTCSSFDSFIQQSSSYFGLENKISLTFNIIIGHYIPADGLIRITLASENDKQSIYGNLETLNASCTIFNFPSGSKCLITTKNITVAFSQLPDPATEYKIIVGNINNPNIDSSLYSNRLTSFFAVEKIMCTKEYKIPFIKNVEIQGCEFSIKPDQTNIGMFSDYAFNIKCGQIKYNSELWIYLPTVYLDNFYDNQILECAGNNVLRSHECVVDLHTIPGKGFIITKVQSLSNSLSFKIKNLKNPIINSYPYQLSGFDFDMFSYTLKYATSVNTYPVTFSPNVTEQSSSSSASQGEFYISRLYPNADESTTYFFSINKYEVLNTTADTIFIEFPSNAFRQTMGKNIKCGWYITEKPSFKEFVDVKYLEWKEMVTKNLVNPIFCFNLGYKIVIYNAVELIKINNKYLNIYVQNIYNPSTNYNCEFKVTFSLKNQVIWRKALSLSLSVSESVQALQITQLQLSDYNIRRLSIYDFTIKFKNSVFLETKLYPIIVLNLPNVYLEVLDSQPPLDCRISLGYRFNKPPECKVFGDSVIIKSDKMVNREVDGFQVTYTKLMNPNQITFCESQKATNNYVNYYIELIDNSTNHIYARNFLSSDLVNCIEFKKSSYDIYVDGPRTNYIGLQYSYTIRLETPANGLTIVPIITGNNVGSIYFNPPSIVFNNYDSLEKKFLISSLMNAYEGNYTIKFNIYESSLDQFYLPILDMSLQLLKADINAYGFEKSPIKFDDISEIGINGSEIKVRLYLQNKPSDSFYVKVDIDVYDKEILDVYPNKVNLDASKNDYFFMMKSTKEGPRQKLFFSIGSDHISKDLIPYKLEREYMMIKLVNNRPGLLTLIYDIKTVSLSKNSAKFNVYASETCQISYILTLKGSPKPVKSDFLNTTIYKKALAMAQISTITYYEDITNFIATISFNSQLEADTSYLLYAIAFGKFNTSEIFEFPFKTQELSFGVALKLYFTANITFSDVIWGLAKTLRVSEKRFYLLNDYKTDNVWVPEIMNQRAIIYEIVLSPDPLNDEMDPLDIARLMNTNEYKGRLKKILPLFNDDKQVLVYTYRLNKPWIVEGPKVILRKYYEVFISIGFVQRTRIFAIRIKVDSNITTILNKPTSKQILKGMTAENDPLRKTEYYVYRGVTDEKGVGVIHLEDLIDGEEYDVYITAGNNLMYDPPVLLPDEEVQYIRVKTVLNQNVRRIGNNINQG